MTTLDPAREVARIKAGYTNRDAAWLAAIRTCLADGPATTRQLAAACNTQSRGAFSTFLYALKRSGTLVVVGSAPGPSGYPNSLWAVAS